MLHTQWWWLSVCLPSTRESDAGQTSNLLTVLHTHERTRKHLSDHNLLQQTQIVDRSSFRTKWYTHAIPHPRYARVSRDFVHKMRARFPPHLLLTHWHTVPVAVFFNASQNRRQWELTARRTNFFFEDVKQAHSHTTIFHRFKYTHIHIWERVAFGCFFLVKSRLK